MSHQFKMGMCNVCHVNEAIGVFSSRIAPVSSAYCQSCSASGAEPYGVVVLRCALLQNCTYPDKLTPHMKYVVEASLRVAGKTHEQLAADIEQQKLEIQQRESGRRLLRSE